MNHKKAMPANGTRFSAIATAESGFIGGPIFPALFIGGTALSGRSAEIIEFVRGCGPGGAKTAQVTSKFGKDAAQYLRRHVESGRLAKPKRGLYVVSEPSEMSEGQVRVGEETDTGLLEVSETDPEAGQ